MLKNVILRTCTNECCKRLKSDVDTVRFTSNFEVELRDDYTGSMGRSSPRHALSDSLELKVEGLRGANAGSNSHCIVVGEGQSWQAGPHLEMDPLHEIINHYQSLP